MIELSDKKIGDIAYDTGFTNANRLTDVFKKEMKCTPIEYRKKIRNENN